MDSLFSQLEFRETEGGGGGRGKAEKKKRERGVLKSPCEESAISQAKCEWLTQLSEGGESIPRGERGMFCWMKAVGWGVTGG